MGSTSSEQTPAATVGAEDLVCPGCGDRVVGERPSSWLAGAGEIPEFSHPDGSVLCPDGRGCIGEPVEQAAPAGRVGARYWLTAYGEAALGVAS